MNIVKILATIIVITAALACVSPTAAVPLVGVTDEGYSTGYFAGVTSGYEFSLSEGYMISRLGLFDYQQDGLLEGHQVGVWDSAGNLVSSGTVPGGTTSELEGLMRWVDVDDFFLTPGTYTVGANYATGSYIGGEEIRFNNSVVLADGVTLIDAMQNNWPGFSRPTFTTYQNTGTFGPGLDGMPISSLVPTNLANVTDAGCEVGYPAGMTVGWEFTLDEPKLIMDLGVFDEGQDGLNETHAVGIWNAAGTLLAATTIGAGTSAPLDGLFRYGWVSPTMLPAGTYTIGSYYATASASGGDPLGVKNTMTLSEGVTWIDSKQNAWPGFSQPTLGTMFDPGIFGPNARFGAVPEPSTFVLAAVGVICLIALRWRRRR